MRAPSASDQDEQSRTKRVLGSVVRPGHRGATQWHPSKEAHVSTSPLTTPAPKDFLAEPLRVGAPDVCGPLAVFPLFGPSPGLEYVAFAQATTLGVTVKELAGGASVNDLLVVNPSPMNVLLYEGEEVLGAQQNRTFDVTVLVAAATQLQVPVSCVERGRWDGTRGGEAFSPAPQAAYPELRRLKNRAARERVSMSLDARANQSEVWSDIAHKSARMAAASRTDAMHDIYETRRERLDEFADTVRLHDDQCGAVVAIAGRPVVLDHVSRSDVFAVLHAPLVQGYALDALEASDSEPPSTEMVEEFLADVLGSRVSERDGIGLGREIRFTAPRVGGAGLVSGDELIQLTAFAENENGSTPVGPTIRSRINRPSRRRSA